MTGFEDEEHCELPWIRALKWAAAFAVCFCLLTVIVSNHKLHVDIPPPSASLLDLPVPLFVLLGTYTPLATPVSGISTSFLLLLIAMRSPLWRRRFEILGAIPLLMLLLNCWIPQAVGRLAPDSEIYSFPDMALANAVAFYGFGVLLGFRVNEYVGGLVILLLACITVARVVLSIYGGTAWSTDLIGSMLLGLTIVSLASALLKYVERSREVCDPA